MRRTKPRLGSLGPNHCMSFSAEKAFRDAKDIHFAPLLFLCWHKAGNWGEVTEAERKTNELATSEGGHEIRSVHRTKLGQQILIVTNADKTMTTILLPEEY